MSPSTAPRGGGVKTCSIKLSTRKPVLLIPRLLTTIGQPRVAAHETTTCDTPPCPPIPRHCCAALSCVCRLRHCIELSPTAGREAPRHQQYQQSHAFREVGHSRPDNEACYFGKPATSCRGLRSNLLQFVWARMGSLVPRGEPVLRTAALKRVFDLCGSKTEVQPSTTRPASRSWAGFPCRAWVPAAKRRR